MDWNGCGGRYVQRLRLVKTCSRYLIEAYFAKNPLKCWYVAFRPILCFMHRQLCIPHCSYLRHDSLAQLLTYANVRAGADIIVVDSSSGFLTGAVAEKMGGMHAFHNDGETL